MQGLGFIDSFGSFTLGSAVSGDGAILVGHGNSEMGANPHALRWDETNGFDLLGTLPGGEYHSLANDVSDDGSTIVGTAKNSSGDFEAFRFLDSSGMMEGLGFLSDTHQQSRAAGTTENGRYIVGNSLNDNGEEEAFIWIEGRGMRAVYDTLVISGLDMEGWRLLSADEVVFTPDGKVVFVGRGIFEGVEQGFVASVTRSVFPNPEPGTYLLLGSSLALVSVRRKQAALVTVRK